MQSATNTPAYSAFLGSNSLQSPASHRSTSTFKVRALKTRKKHSDDDPEDPSNDPSKHPSRREIILGAVNLAILGDVAAQVDGTTVVNSILGAYGLPQLKAAKGFNLYDDFDLDYVFEYPKSWVQRKNTLRPGIYISDFNTADKLTVETFSAAQAPSVETDELGLAKCVVVKLLNPAVEIGGDDRLELPPDNKIKTSKTEIDGQKYLYVTFPSETITRSGYQVKRKNIAVAAEKRGIVYCLGTSARNDQWNKDKEALMKHVVESFRLR